MSKSKEKIPTFNYNCTDYPIRGVCEITGKHDSEVFVCPTHNHRICLEIGTYNDIFKKISKIGYQERCIFKNKENKTILDFLSPFDPSHNTYKHQAAKNRYMCFKCLEIKDGTNWGKAWSAACLSEKYTKKENSNKKKKKKKSGERNNINKYCLLKIMVKG